MKTKLNVIGLAIFLIVGQNTALSAETVETQTQGPVTIKWYSASLPREDVAVPAHQGASWPTASSNWMEAIRTDSPTVGTDRNQVTNIRHNDYAGMVSSSNFSLWRSNAETSSEYGNRQHYGFKMYSQIGSFTPNNITYTISSQVWNGTGWVNQIYSGVTSSMAQDNNPFRQRLNAGVDTVYGTVDDVFASSQVMSSPTNSFIYGGYGIGISAYGNGTNQDKINNALAYMQGGKLRVVLMVSVLHSNGTTYTFSNTYMPPCLDMSQIKAVYSPSSGGSGAYISWPSDPSSLYLVAKSPDMMTWSPVSGNGYYDGGTPLTSVVTAEQPNLESKCFYRIQAW
jgi:hypothetical protein